MRIGAKPTGSHIVHPCTTPFARAGRWIEVKLAYQLSLALDAVEPYSRVPNGRFVFMDLDFKQRLDDLEQALQNLGRSEVLLDLLFAETVARFLELFANIRPVPSLRILQI